MAQLVVCAPKLAPRAAKLISGGALSRQNLGLGATLDPLYMRHGPGLLCTAAVPATQVCLAPLFLLIFFLFLHRSHTGERKGRPGVSPAEG